MATRKVTTPLIAISFNASDFTEPKADPTFDAWISRIQARYNLFINPGNSPIFTTDVEGLFHLYLSRLPASSRQHHTCNCCRRFFENYGGLVVLDSNGGVLPLMWNVDDAPGFYKKAIEAVFKAVQSATITGVFYADTPRWGTKEAGGWTHFFVSGVAVSSLTKTPYQLSAEKLEDHKNMHRALGEFSVRHLEQAVMLLKEDALYRSDKVLGQAEWLLKLRRDFASSRTSIGKDRILWKAVASAPTGFCHPRASMIGTLLTDLADGLPLDEVRKSFNAKMHPLAYQRPQAAPARGNIMAAEKLIEKLGLTKSLDRRFARLDEMETVWASKGARIKRETASGSFSHLLPKALVGTPSGFPVKTMTWAKFHSTVLPEALRIEVFIQHSSANFITFTSATHDDAPTLFKWANPIAWYVYHGGSEPRRFNLKPGEWCRATAIVKHPNEWNRDAMTCATIILAGCRDTMNRSLGLFPECMRSELHEVRSVIEAHSRSRKLTGLTEASACGLRLHDGTYDTAHWLRVTKADGRTYEYVIDRWD